MKIKYFIDSSATLSEKEASKKGLGYIPLFFYLNDKEYASGVDLPDEKFYNMINLDMETRTAAAPASLMKKAFKKALETHDYVIAYLTSYKISAQTPTAISVAKEMKNVYVIPSTGFSYGIVKDIEYLEMLNKKGATIEEIIKAAEQLTKQHCGVIIPKSLKWFIKGGRISKSVGRLAEIFKVFPILVFKDGKLEKYGKARLYEKAILKGVKKLQEEYQDRKMIWSIYHGKNVNIEEMIKKIKSILGKVETIRYFPAVGGAHSGPEMIAVFGSQDPKKLKK